MFLFAHLANRLRLKVADAQVEAVREGASPIELVDGQGLVALLEQLELRLIPRKTYEVDLKFFEEFAR